MKLAVGVPSLEEFEDRIEARRRSGSGMQVWTRSFPKRADDVVGAGSLYWVVAGLLSARQPILTIEEDTYNDGSRCARIEVEPVSNPDITVAHAPVPRVALSATGGSAGRFASGRFDRADDPASRVAA